MAAGAVSVYARVASRDRTPIPPSPSPITDSVGEGEGGAGGKGEGLTLPELRNSGKLPSYRHKVKLVQLMTRRSFMQSALVGVGAGLAGPALALAQPEWRSKGKWIIPSNKPDRFMLKVMAFNPIPAPDPQTWTLTIGGLTEEAATLKVGDLERFTRIEQNSRLKCVQCWSGRVNWEGFRGQDLVKLVRPKAEAGWVRVECADKYFDFVKMEDLLHPRTLFAVGMNGEALSPEHGAPLRLVLPHKYGYKSSKLITKLTFIEKGGRGLVADGWPYYSETGDILPGIDHPWEFPDEPRKIKGGEITEY
jgi:methionine sulfoxide reductase catalytic subunit